MHETIQDLIRKKIIKLDTKINESKEIVRELREELDSVEEKIGFLEFEKTILEGKIR